MAVLPRPAARRVRGSGAAIARRLGEDRVAGWAGPSADELARTAVDRWNALIESGAVVMFGEPTGEPVRLVDVDESWRPRFEAVAIRLRGALHESALRIEHVGSTAVPGIVAKPVIDVQVSVSDVEDEASYALELDRLGWPMRSREPGHRYFRTPKGAHPRIQVHVCQAGGEWEREHLLFRDYLLAHARRAAAYGELKRELAGRYGHDRLAYTEAKTPFIRSTLALAEDWALATGWALPEVGKP